MRAQAGVVLSQENLEGQDAALRRVAEGLERVIGQKAEKRFVPMQPGDVPSTYADISELAADTGFAPATTLEHGLGEFVRWYRDYHRA